MNLKLSGHLETAEKVENHGHYSKSGSVHFRLVAYILLCADMGNPLAKFQIFHV
jgi:hypothetical protein